MENKNEQTGYDLTQAGPLVVERFDEATQRDDKDGDNICILHGLEKAMIGTAEIGDNTVAVYERSLCIKCIADGYTDEDTRTLHSDEYSQEQLQDPEFLYELKLQDADEYFEYNTERSLPYAKDAAPVIVDGFFPDSERWEAFKDACNK